MSFTDVETNETSTLLAHYKRIIDISTQLNSTFDHVSLLKRIVAAVTELTDTEAASILLIDPNTGELRFEISSNLNPHEMEDMIVPMEGSIAGWVATHGEPRVIFDVQREPGHFGTIDDTIEFQTRNMVAVPMRTHKKVIGVLEAINKIGNQRFTDIDINTLNALANHAAIAIENARLFRQSDFIAEMVHELRTPLMSLKASTTLLLRPQITGDRRSEIVSMMQNETDRLMRLTTDFLDLARMESGRTGLTIEPFDLPALIAESVEVVDHQAKNKGIKIEIEDHPYTISGDRGKVKQVLLNLLTNAIKYNRRDGHIRVEVTAHHESTEPTAQIAVADSGYGLSRSNQKQIFQKFFRAGETDKETGTGLGLAITKHIVEAHGGQIWLESEEGVGTTFFFTLPLHLETIK